MLLAAFAAALFALPLVGLIWRAPLATFWDELTAPEILSALRLSLFCSLTATVLAIALGLPLAWVQARTTFPGQRLLRAVTTLPIVLPPVVAGVALLVVFGRRGIVGVWLDAWFGVRLPFTAAGAALAETFVAMPFFVLTMEGALRSVDRRLEDAARTLGASRWTVFRHVTLPLILPSLQAGAILAWARALGEFGATITFAGNVPGRTQTLPLAVYLALETRPEAAFVLSLVLLAVSLVVLTSLRRRWLVW
ncbi:MAG: molybdate transporter, inner rane subunit [Deltaproteobacteria bacterium]|nr:molybdate transporter, inner rane subunit [Deltaproteobacteria bacterium]